MPLSQTVKVFQCAESIGFSSKKLRRRNSITNYLCADSIAKYCICGRCGAEEKGKISAVALLHQPLDCLSYYSCPCLSLLHQAVQTESKAVRIVLKTTPFWAEAKFANLFLKAVQIKEQTGQKICAEIGLTKSFVETENLCAGTAFHTDRTLQSGH